MMEKIHKPVLLKQSIDLLNINPSGVYVDCTLGDGGYSYEIYKNLGGGKLYSFDVDKNSIDFVKAEYEEYLGEKWEVFQDNFSNIQKVLGNISVDGVIFDLGLSSRQIDSEERGFTFLQDQLLDMRMNQDLSVTAEDLLKALSQGELEKLFITYGEERYAKRIARKIKNWVRDNADTTMTTDILVKLIRRVVPAGYRDGSKHPARRVFQALRIAVNDEINTLRAGLFSALSMLNKDGRVVVVSYHSLEDREVKNIFKEKSESGEFEILTPSPITPTAEEIAENNRARSAKLRAVKQNK
jgi:16S rRNA (cytosine1402-N4)-methyltransferase